MTVIDAINLALHECFLKDQRSIYFGEDVEAALRGFSKGLMEKFGENRIRECPISEAAFIGAATGAALKGMNVVVDLQISSLVYVGFDQISNQALKLPFMMGSKIDIPVTYLIPCGSRRALAGQHSDNPYGPLLNMGMDSYMVSNADNAYAITHHCFYTKHPTAIFVPVHLFGAKSESFSPETTGDFHPTRISSGDCATLITNGTTESYVRDSTLRNHLEGFFDHYNLTHLNTACLDQILSSVERTKKCAIVDDSYGESGFSNSLLGKIASQSNGSVKFMSLNRTHHVVPFSRRLEEQVVVQDKRVDAFLKRLIL